MRLLLVSGIYFPDIGGPATYIPRLATKLVSDQNSISVLSLSDNPKQHTPEELWPTFLISRRLPKPIRFLKTVREILRSKNTVDGVYSNGLYEECGTASILGGRLLVAKVVGDPIWERYRNSRNQSISIEEFQKSKLSLSFKIQRIFFVWSLNRFQIITTPSHELSEIIKSWGVTRPIKVIANGIKCDLTERKQFDNSVVSVSRLVTWKNLDLLIRACSGAKLALKIVGEGPEKERLEALANSLEADVVFYGELTRDEVMDVLNKSAIFALISDYEGLSFALLEAMMIGMPILVSNNSGNTQVIENEVSGLIVPIGNIEATQNALSRLTKDERLREFLAKNARELAVANYCEHEQLTRMTSLIELAIGSKKNE